MRSPPRAGREPDGSLHAMFSVYRDQPTLITPRNLQPDDAHDFMLVDPNSTVLMNVLMPPLQDTA